jgi:hypothetical protein
MLLYDWMNQMALAGILPGFFSFIFVQEKKWMFPNNEWLCARNCVILLIQ